MLITYFTDYLTMQLLCYPTIYGNTCTDHKLIALIHSAYITEYRDMCAVLCVVFYVLYWL